MRCGHIGRTPGLEGYVIGVGILGSGFIADAYADALLDVRDAELVANYSRNADRARRLRRAMERVRPHYYRHGASFCADPAIDLVVIALPNEAHLEAVRIAADAGKGVICTKPLARTGAEAAEILRIVRRSRGLERIRRELGVLPEHREGPRDGDGPAASASCSPCGRAKAHSGPHAPHFWDAETAGGGALLDMGCHTVESARHFFGKENAVVEAFAWGATLVHADKTTGEDTAVALLKFAGGQLAIDRIILGGTGRHATASRVLGQRRPSRHGHLGRRPVWGFIDRSPSDTSSRRPTSTPGGCYPVPEETRAYGFSQQMRHFVECFAAGETPLETFEDGWTVNCIIDACYRAMRSGTWEKVRLEP